MKQIAYLVFLLMIPAGFVSAEDLCPCVPLSHQWVVQTCDTWNCAASAAILANGDPHVMAMPAATSDGRWLVVKQVAAGTYAPAADEPFVMESFDGVSAAVAR